MLALALVFAAMYVIAMLLNTTTESFEPIVFEMPKKLAYLSVSAKGFGIREEDFEREEELRAVYAEKIRELTEKLKEREGISDVYYAQILLAQYSSVFGAIGFEVPLIAADEIPGFLAHTDSRLTGGRMPSGEGEILADEVLLKNNGVAIGDSFMPQIFQDTFTVVGSIRSPYMVAVGTPRGLTNSGWRIVVEKEESVYDMTAVLRELGINITEEEQIEDAVESARMYDTEIKGVIDKVIRTIFLLVMIFLAFTVLIAYISYLRNRVRECCLYMSIGYSRSAVYGMLMREMGWIFGAAVLLGVILGLAGGFILHELVIEAKGLVCRVVMPEQIFRLTAAYVLITGILQIPVAWSIHSIKTIDAIED